MSKDDKIAMKEDRHTNSPKVKGEKTVPVNPFEPTLHTASPLQKHPEGTTDGGFCFLL